MTETSRRTVYLYLTIVYALMFALVSGCGSGDSAENGENTAEDSPGYVDVLLRARKNAAKTQCMANLHALGSALQAYAASHNNKLPHNLNDLVTTNILSSDSVLKCPSSEGLPYIYTPPTTRAAPMSTIVIRDPGPVHLGKVNVLYLNGAVDSLSPEELEAATTSRPAKSP